VIAAIEAQLSSQTKKSPTKDHSDHTKKGIKQTITRTVSGDRLSEIVQLKSAPLPTNVKITKVVSGSHLREPVSTQVLSLTPKFEIVGDGTTRTIRLSQAYTEELIKAFQKAQKWAGSSFSGFPRIPSQHSVLRLLVGKAQAVSDRGLVGRSPSTAFEPLVCLLFCWQAFVLWSRTCNEADRISFPPLRVQCDSLALGGERACQQFFHLPRLN
jgi:hypothetical protein